MPYKNTAVTVTLLVWDTVNGIGKTGQSATLTLRGVGDGSVYTPSSPSVTELDSTNLKGLYSVALTAGENNYSFVSLGGICSTAGCIIQPISWTNECSVTSSAVASVTGNVGGNVTGSVGSVSGNVGGNVVGSVASVTGNVGGNVTGSVGSVTGNLGGNVAGSVAGSVGSVAAAVTIASGQLFIKKNTALNNFTFMITKASNHQPFPGATVTATRSIDGAAFAACANAVTELSNGFYKINLAATDMNGTVIAFKFTAPGADDRDFTVVTQA